MQAKLLKIKLVSGSHPELEKLITYMMENHMEPLNEMKQKGYMWDSVFLDESDSLYIVIKSEDFTKIMMDESELIHTPFRAMYEKFRQDCWSSEPYSDIEPLACFNSSVDFLGSEFLS
jgi:hypothetical protein